MKRLSCLLFVLCVSSLPALSGSPEWNSVFARIGTEEGLSQETTLSIVQDRTGCMWFSSYNGLNRYDGNEIRVFRSEAESGEGLPCNAILDLYSDTERDQLWVGTQQGFAVMDLTDGKIRRVTDKYCHRLYGFIEPREGELWAATSDGLMSFSTEGDDFKAELRDTTVFTSLVKNGGRIWAGDQHGRLWVTEKDSPGFSMLDIRTGHNPILGLEFETGDILWIGSDGDGLFRLDLRTMGLSHFTHSYTNSSSLCSNYVHVIKKDRAGNLWIGTGNKLSVLNPHDMRFTTIGHDPRFRQSLSHNSVWSIFMDDAGGIWLGTFYGGVNYYHPVRDNFRTMGLHFWGDMTGVITGGPGGTVWIGTNRHGIKCYNPADGSISDIYTDEGGRDVEGERKDIKSIMFNDDYSKALVGAALGGFKILDLRSGEIKDFSNRQDTGDVYCILPDRESRYWIGGSEGLLVYDDKTGELAGLSVPEIEGTVLMFMFRDSGGRIWIGTDNKLLSCRAKTLPGGAADISGVKEYPISSVVDIHESRNGELWSASSQGLYRFDTEEERWTVCDGFSGIIVKGIEEDGSGALWISSENGMSRFDPVSGEIRMFTRNDGLQENKFSSYAHTVSSDGTMYFGGWNGVTIFNPGKFSRNMRSPAPMLTELTVNGKTVLPGDGSGILSKDISRTSRIDIYHRQNNFSLGLGVTNYVSWRGNRFSYMLEGVDKDWVEGNGERVARYSNLRGGKYRFLLKSANSEGIWSDTVSPLVVVIHPVWYKTMAASAVWLLLFIGTLTAGVVVIIHKNRSKDLAAMARIERSKQKEIDRLRIQSFLNPSGAGRRYNALSGEDEAFLIKAYRTVEENMSNEDFSMEDFASALGTNRTSLHVRIKGLTGESALEFVKRIRFERACTLLKERKLTVAEVGYAIGCSSPAYFATSFRKYMGMTPKEYSSVKGIG